MENESVYMLTDKETSESIKKCVYGRLQFVMELFNEKFLYNSGEMICNKLPHKIQGKMYHSPHILLEHHR